MYSDESIFGIRHRAECIHVLWAQLWPTERLTVTSRYATRDKNDHRGKWHTLSHRPRSFAARVPVWVRISLELPENRMRSWTSQSHSLTMILPCGAITRQYPVSIYLVRDRKFNQNLNMRVAQPFISYCASIYLCVEKFSDPLESMHRASACASFYHV